MESTIKYIEMKEQLELILEGYITTTFNKFLEEYKPAKEYIDEINKGLFLSENKLDYIVVNHVQHMIRNKDFEIKLNESYNIFNTIINLAHINFENALDDFKKFYCVRFLELYIKTCQL